MNKANTDQFHFEQQYVSIRKKEDRLFSIDQIRDLPRTNKEFPHYKEWQLRSKTAEKFKIYLNGKKFNHVLDLGCGNGWFINYLYKADAFFTGIEVNNLELGQARVLHENRTNVELLLADVFSYDFENKFDVIVVNAVVQYFHPLHTLLNRLIELLEVQGEIHILDSPFYKNSSDVAEAKSRSKTYFTKMGVPMMNSYYHHHSYPDLKNYNTSILYNPSNIYRKVARALGMNNNPFPWIRITAADQQQP